MYKLRPSREMLFGDSLAVVFNSATGTGTDQFVKCGPLTATGALLRILALDAQEAWACVQLGKINRAVVKAATSPKKYL
jgi:hypothetical protein